MSSFQQLTNSVQWHDGMLLSPQHLQRAFGRSEDLVHTELAEFISYAYGFRRLTLDASSLTNGLLRVDEVECLFPDGLVFHHESKADGPLELDLGGHEDTLRERGVIVYLCVASRSQTTGKGLGGTRYRTVDSDYLYDENTGQDPIVVQLLRPQVFLQLGTASEFDVVRLPVARVHFENNQYVLDDYSAPFLRVTKGSLVWRLCNQFLKNMRQKVLLLSADLRETPNQQLTFAQLNRFHLMQGLKKNLYLMDISLRHEQCHPFALFQSLHSMVSDVCSWQLGDVMPNVIDYDHFDVYGVFHKITNLVESFVEQEIPSQFNIKKAVLAGGRFIFTLDRSSFVSEGKILLGLKKPYRMGREEFLGWIKNAIMCQDSQFEVAQTRKILGFQRVQVDKFDSLLSTRDMYLVLVQVEGMGPGASFVMASNSMVVEESTSGPEDVQIYIRKAAGDAA